MYGPPGMVTIRFSGNTLTSIAGTGKTLLARACAAQTEACYLKLAGPALVQVSLFDSLQRISTHFPSLSDVHR